MITNFEKVREDAMKLLDQENTPDMAKEYIVKMMADERSLACMINLVAILAVISPTFGMVLHRSIRDNMALALLSSLNVEDLLNLDKLDGKDGN